jgi:hypothetical protein
MGLGTAAGARQGGEAPRADEEAVVGQREGEAEAGGGVAAEGAVLLGKQQPEGAVDIQVLRKMRLDKAPRGTAGATAGAGAKQGPRSVRAREVLGGDDTDSDGDETPRAEEQAVEGAAGEAAEVVKAEPAPALEPAIKPESSISRCQQQQQQEEEQSTCVRSAKRRAVWARGGAGGPRACVRGAGEAAAAAGYLQTEKMCGQADR